MFLKKINQNLNASLTECGFTVPNELQAETFSLIKSGRDAVISAPSGSGKTTTLALNVIQRLEVPFEQSPRALVIVENREKVIDFMEVFETLSKYNHLRVYSVYEQTDLAHDKNQICVGIHVSIGTRRKVDELLSGAAFDINRLKMFVVDDIEVLLKKRNELLITRP